MPIAEINATAPAIARRARFDIRSAVPRGYCVSSGSTALVSP
jgi:hypothetical protein